MRIASILSIALAGGLLIACNGPAADDTSTEQAAGPASDSTASADPLIYEGEDHFASVRQLTFGGENAEAYWSNDDRHIVFQRTAPEEGLNCDQIFLGATPATGEDFAFDMVSTGGGRTTCSYFLPGDSTIIYASTHLDHDSCPPVPDQSMGYVWPLYPEFELFITDTDGTILEQLTDNDHYDAEATAHPTENKIVYTSDKSGDLELYILDLDTREEVQVTNTPGYDGGAFFSPDGSMLLWRASRPAEGEELDHYQDLLSNHMVEPSDMELFVANADGSDARQITDLGGANWAPFFHPSNEKIVFSSNHHTERGFPFNLFMIDLDGSNLQQITFDPMFDAFPMFSRDGTHLLFSSNRNNGGTRNTNVFLVEWQD